MLELKRLFEEKATRTMAMEKLLNTAKKENRDLTSAESREWNRLSAEVEEYNDIIRPMEENNRANAAKAAKQAQADRGGFLSEKWVDVRSGNNIDVLNTSERFVDTLAHNERGGSLARYIHATVTGDWRNAEFEQRAMSSAPGSAGVTVPFSLMANILDQARSKSVLMAAGVKSVKMDSNNLTIAKVVSDPEFQYKAENAAFTYSDMTFGKVELNTFTLGTAIRMSRELAADAPNAVQAIERVLAEAIAAEIDRVGLFGTGTTQPLGLMNQAIQEVAAGGGLVDYSKFVDAWVKILQVNQAPNAYIISPRDAGKLEQLVAGADGQYLKAPDAIAKLTRHISSKVPINLGAGTNESVSFLGDFTQCLFGIRQGFLLETSTEAGSLFENHQLGMKLTWRGDFALVDPNAITKITGITA